MNFRVHYRPGEGSRFAPGSIEIPAKEPDHARKEFERNWQRGPVIITKVKRVGEHA